LRFYNKMADKQEMLNPYSIESKEDTLYRVAL